ncbi:MAG: hypothetical protein H0U86_03035 [Chloroflexi bacterium]|nr:hypothetical protein [Chloroflexota bacterium]
MNERTRLDEVAPGAVIEFSRPTYYGELLRLIQAHAYELSEARGEFVSLPEATRDWYSESWLSALEAIETTGLRRAYDFKTPGDLYLWTSQKLRELRTTDPRATWTDAACSPANPSTGPIAARRWPPVASRCRPTATRPETTAAGSPLLYVSTTNDLRRARNPYRNPYGPCPMRLRRPQKAVSVLGETPGTDPDASDMRYHPFGQVPICAQIEPISARWASSSTLISTLMRSRRSPRWLTIGHKMWRRPIARHSMS